MPVGTTFGERLEWRQQDQTLTIITARVPAILSHRSTSRGCVSLVGPLSGAVIRSAQSDTGADRLQSWASTAKCGRMSKTSVPGTRSKNLFEPRMVMPLTGSVSHFSISTCRLESVSSGRQVEPDVSVVSSTLLTSLHNIQLQWFADQENPRSRNATYHVDPSRVHSPLLQANIPSGTCIDTFHLRTEPKRSSQRLYNPPHHPIPDSHHSSSNDVKHLHIPNSVQQDKVYGPPDKLLSSAVH